MRTAYSTTLQSNCDRHMAHTACLDHVHVPVLYWKKRT